MPALTRRRSTDAPEEWGWDCGFYPGSHPGEHQSGTAATFDQARADFPRVFIEPDRG
jgi:hypothetical protein